MPAASVGPAPQVVDFQSWSAINATPFDFVLNAGVFGLTISASVFGTATLRRYVTASDSYVAVSAALAANGYTELHLPAGQYQLTLSGITALSGMIEKIGPWGGR